MKFFNLGNLESQALFHFDTDRNNLGASIILTWVHAKIASRVSPVTPGSIEIVSKNFATAIWDAEARGSESTALYPSSSLTLCPQSTTRAPLYFWRCFASSAFFKWLESIGFSKMNSFPSSFVWRTTSDFGRTFFTSHVGSVKIYVHYFHTAALASGIFKASWTETGLWTNRKW